MKGVTYQEDDAPLWESLLGAQAQVREYVAQIGLELILVESEGYAYLRQRPAAGEAEELPRLMPRRQLGYSVSLILALLRKRLAEFDASSGDTRLILSRDEIANLVRIFLPESSNEARWLDRIDADIKRIVELGFLRRLRGQEDKFEVRRILKAFVDTQWISDFNQRLAGYRSLHSSSQATLEEN
jgi:hypothetical protein